eukprot:2678465-Prymnesium_polylepis.1
MCATGKREAWQREPSVTCEVRGLAARALSRRTPQAAALPDTTDRRAALRAAQLYLNSAGLDAPPAGAAAD